MRKSRQSSIGKSEHIEIGQDFGCNVTEKYLQRIGGEEERIVDGKRRTKIGAQDKLIVKDEYSLIGLNEVKIFAHMS